MSDTAENLIVDTFDISTAQHVDATLVSNEDTSPRDIAFSSNGTKMFVIGISKGGVNEYTLSNMTFGISVARTGDLDGDWVLDLVAGDRGTTLVSGPDDSYVAPPTPSVGIHVFGSAAL